MAYGDMPQPTWPYVLAQAERHTKVIEERDEALRRVAELEYLLGLYTEWRGPGVGIVEPVKAGHGACCTCPKCGRDYDDCVCEHNEIEALLQAAKKSET